MDHHRERLLIVGRDLAHGLNYLTQGHDRGCGHEHRFLCPKVHGSYGWTIQRFFLISKGKNDTKATRRHVGLPRPDHPPCRQATPGLSPTVGSPYRISLVAAIARTWFS